MSGVENDAYRRGPLRFVVATRTRLLDAPEAIEDGSDGLDVRLRERRVHTGRTEAVRRHTLGIFKVAAMHSRDGKAVHPWYRCSPSYSAKKGAKKARQKPQGVQRS